MQRELGIGLILMLAGCTTGSWSLSRVSDEPVGDNCAHGGAAVLFGMDDDRDGVLDTEEVDTTTYVCNGADGVAGVNGNDGSNGDSGTNGSLVEVQVEPAGKNCPFGGQRIDWGIDDDGNGTLDAKEVDNSTWVCNGTNGLSSLVAIVDEPWGSDDCADGGLRIEHGIDTNADGVLDAKEVEGTTFICDPPGPVPREFAGSGIRHDLPIADFLAGGWQVCHQDTYDTLLTLSDVTAACQGVGTDLAVGCTDDTVDPGTFVVVAGDTDAVVFPATPDSNGATAHRTANGVGWYATENWSFGFFREGDGVVRDTADQATGDHPEDRLSWHTHGTVGGYRCGTTDSLNNDASFSRYVLVYNAP